MEWGAIDAANYRYIQEYSFRDDGVIIGRIGATGQNLPGEPLVTHAHNAIWRIDIDLDGVTNNAARLQHIENPAKVTPYILQSFAIRSEEPAGLHCRFTFGD